MVQDDLNDRRLALNLGKHIAECKHGEAAVAAERDCLPARKGELCAESIGSSVGHRAPRKRAKDSALVSTFDVPGGPDAGRAGVHEKHGVGTGKIAESRREKLRPDRLDARSLFDIVTQEFFQLVS